MGFNNGHFPGAQGRQQISNKQPRDSARAAASRFKVDGQRGIDWVYFQLSETERNAFDQMLVNIKHPLAHEAGTNEYRFRTYVKELAQ